MESDNVTDFGLKGEYKFLVEFYVFSVSENFVAFCPILDITASGKDFDEAVVDFHDELDFYIQECLEMGTLIEDMVANGWKVEESQLIPPTFAEQMKNDTLKVLINSHIGFEKIVFPVSVIVD